MGKLGKKARKFAQKNLQSVLRQRRKFKSMKDSRRRKRVFGSNNDISKGHVAPEMVKSNASEYEGQCTKGADDISLDVLVSEDDDMSIDNESESDGYLSEELEYTYLAGSEDEHTSEGEVGSTDNLLVSNMETHLKLENLKKKLEKLKRKELFSYDFTDIAIDKRPAISTMTMYLPDEKTNPDFSTFVEAHRSQLTKLQTDGYSSGEEDESDDQHGLVKENAFNVEDCKVMTNSLLDAWFKLVLEKHDMLAYRNLLNRYRASCHYGLEDVPESASQRILNKRTFCKVLMFVLHESDGIFRKVLGVKTSCKKETILEMKVSSKWITVKPLLKSYLRSTVCLLQQATDCQILEFTLSRLRSSIVFLAAFPSVLRKFIQVSVHLFATGRGALSISAFLAIRDVANEIEECLDSILMKLYRAFIANCKFVEFTTLKHMQFLGDCVTEIYSIDIQASSDKALASVQKIARTLQLALKTKRKDVLKIIYDWQYINCIDLWVKFISMNIEDCGIRSLLYLVIQIINGVVHLFTGPRYLPLRLKCVRMLNQLSHSSGVFIPVASLVLSSLEYSWDKRTDERPSSHLKFSSVLKVPKYLLKSQNFQQECIISAVELLSAHFAQWSYHITFPELSVIPLIRLKRFYSETTVESHRHLVKPLIEQVEKNVEFVHKRREEIAFSPKDQALVDSFLQLEKNGRDAPFILYYDSVLEKSVDKNKLLKGKTNAS